jgi:hypothetical protein
MYSIANSDISAHVLACLIPDIVVLTACMLLITLIRCLGLQTIYISILTSIYISYLRSLFCTLAEAIEEVPRPHREAKQTRQFEISMEIMETSPRVHLMSFVE